MSRVSVSKLITFVLGFAIAASVATAAPVTQNLGPNFGTFSVGQLQLQLPASGGDGTHYLWEVVDGFGSLPPGITLRTDTPSWFPPSTRAGLEGVAITAGTYHFRLRTTSGPDVIEGDYSITISSLVVKDWWQVFDAFVGESYAFHLTAMRDGAPVSAAWAPACCGSYPNGISLSPDGVLQGVPTTPGTYNFSYSVTEGADTVYKGGQITVYRVDIPTADLPNATPGVSYAGSITASGGTGSYTFVVNGSLPFGLTLTPSGSIIGTTNNGPGRYWFNVTATDSGTGASYTKSMSIDVLGVPPALPSIQLYGSTLNGCTFGAPCTRGVSVVSGGRAPFTWTASGLPPGMSIRFGSGLTLGWITPDDVEIWGNPVALGLFQVQLTVTDADGLSSTNTFPMIVSAIVVSDYFANNATFGSPYSSTIRLIGGAGPYTAAIVSGYFPTGLVFDGTTLTLGGTPLESGNFNVRLQFGDSGGNTLDQWFGVFVSGPININDYNDLGTALVNTSYSRQFFACCAASMTWSVIDPVHLPHGLNFSSGGVLSGTPDVPGAYSFTVQAADSSNPARYAQRQFTLNVTPVFVTTGYQLPFGNVGSQYGGSPSGLQLNASGGTGPYTWTLQASQYLPPGLSLTSSGRLTGTPTATGQYQFSVAITDAAGHSGVGYFSLSIYPAGGAPPPGFNFNTNLGTWTIGQVDGVQLTGTGGNGSYAFSLVGGTLPPGLSIRTDVPSFFPAGSSGLIGVATTPGTYQFQLGVTSAGQTTAQTFTMKIIDFVVKDLFSSPDGFINQSYTYQLTALRGGAPVAATFTPNGPLPAGLNLSSSGFISGTPTTSGFNNVSFRVSDGVDTIFRSVGFNVNAFYISTSGDIMPNATQNAFFSTPALTTVGGSGPYSYSVSGSTPNGLSLNSSTGVLSGTITAGTGTFAYTINVTDSSNPSLFYSKRFTLNVVGAVPVLPQVTAFNNPISDCTIGVPCTHNFGVQSGGSAPFTWSAQGLPPGMDIRWGNGNTSSYLNPTQVELWGTPTSAGLFNITLTVIDATGVSASQTFPLNVSVLMTTNGLSNGVIETSYSSHIRVIGGAPGYTAAQNGGLLPNGLSLGTSTLAVSGTPHESGSFSPALVFTDTIGNTLQSWMFFSINGGGSGLVGISTNSNLPIATQGSFYSQQLFGCCPSELTWSLITPPASLPPGITLSAGGLLSGTPTSSGTFTFLVRAADPANAGNYGQRAFTLSVTTVSISTNSTLPFGNVGTPYSATLTATGGTSPYAWTLAPFNLLPPGLALHTSGGVTTIDGTPTTVGFFSFSLNVVDAAGRVSSRNFTVSIYPAGAYPPLNWTLGPNLGPSPVGVIAVQLSGVTGGLAPYHFSLTPAAAIVPGIRVQDGQPLPTNFPTSVTGGFVGVVTTPGVYNTSIRVTDALGNSFDRAVALTVSPLQILSQFNLPKALRNTAYSFTLAPYPAGAYTWTATNLPAGLSINASTGEIAGTPTVSGTFSVNVTLRASPSIAVTIGFNLVVNPFDITTGGVLTQGTVGSAYSTTLTAPGCGGSCSWSVTQGSLPGGLSLNGSTGVISGTPTGTSNGSFTVQASGAGNNVSKVFSLRIVASTPQVLSITNGSSFGFSTVGGSVSQSLSAQGGTLPYTWAIDSGTLPPGVTLQGPGETVGSSLAPGFMYLAGRTMDIGPGVYNFVIKVTDSAAVPAVVTKAMTWTVTPINLQYNSLPVSFGGTVLTPLVYKSAYTQPLLALGGTGTYAWSSLTPLPTGLSLDPATGVVSGTPLNTGSFNVTIQAVDGSGATVQSNLTVNIAGPTGTLLSFNTGASLGTFTRAQPSSNLSPTGGTGGPYTLTAVTALPPGFAIESGDSLLTNTAAGTPYFLAGTPLATGPFAVVIEARDALGNVGARTFTLTISPLSLAISTSLSDASVGVPYSQSILTWDIAGTPIWTPTTALPPGLSLVSNVLTGTPTSAGNFNFTLSGTDASGLVVNVPFTLRVSNIAITDPQVLPAAAVAGVPFSYTFTATGGGSKTWSANSLPQGFSLSSSGTLTGTTSSLASAQTVIVTVNDGGFPLQRRFTLFTRGANRTELDFPMTSAALPDAVIGLSFANALVPTGGTPPYVWSVPSGSALPVGLNLIDTSTLGSLSGGFTPGVTLIAGAPTTEGQYAFDLMLTDAAGASLRRTFTLNVASINILPGTPRAATAGVAYAEQFIAVGGTPPYTFSMTPQGPTQDMLPPGLTFSPAGRIAGVTSSTGGYAFVLHVQDAAGHTFSRTYSGTLALNVNNAGGLRVSNTNLFDVKVGAVPFAQNLFTNGNSTYTWTVAPGSSLPPGLVLLATPPYADPNQPLIGGQAAAAGTYVYTLRATDTANASNFADHTFTLNVVPMHLVSPPQRFMSIFQLPPGEAGAFYSFAFKAAGGTPPYAYSVSPFNPLPPGMTLSSDGVLSGTPPTIGNYSVGLYVTDAAGYVLHVPAGYSLVVTPPGAAAPMNMSGAYLPFGSVGAPVRGLPLDIFVRGGRAPFIFSADPSSLPPGVVILPGGHGVSSTLGGIPTTPGSYEYLLTVTDAAGQVASATFRQSVSTITLTPGKVPPGRVGTPYPLTLTASGGSAPYTFQVDPTSDFPAGLTLSASGVFSGTPTIAGDYLSVVTVTDSTANSFSALYLFTVDNAAGEAPAVTLAPDSLLVNYLQGAAGGAAIPIPVTTTSGAQAFTLLASGIPGATFAPPNGIATEIVSLNLDAAPLATGTYVGSLGVNAPASAKPIDYTSIVLNVAPPGSDTTPPTIGLVGDIVAEATSAAGAIVVFATPTVTDNFYPAPTISVGPPSGTQFPIGATLVTATATDSSGNVSVKTFTVTVADTTAPALSVPADITTQATGAAGAIVTYTATALDVVDGAVTPVCLPASGSTFGLGATPVNCTATDAHGNVAYGSLTVTVVDTIGPAIVVSSPVSGAGYVFGQPVVASYTCADAVGIGSCIGTVDSDTPIDTSTLGPHVFTVTAFDVDGNMSSVAIPYAVIELPRIQVASPVEPIYELGSVVLAQYTCANSITCIGDISNGAVLDTSSPGLKSFAINATDAYGNMASQIVTYSVSLGACVMPFANMTAWLTGDLTPIDEIGGNSIWVGSAAYEPGRVGQAFSFGNGPYVTLPLTQPGSFTLQGWVRTTNRLLPWGTGVLSTGVSGQEAVTAQVELDGAGNYQLTVGNYDVVLFIGPATESFQHIAATYDQATGTISTYLNGQLVDFNTWFGSPDLGIQLLNLGINRQALGAPFAGALDEVQTFDRALTADEVMQTFLTGSSGLCRDQSPTAVASAPSPVEATGPDGATVLLDGTGSSDPDGDPLAYTWREGATTLGSTSTLSKLFSLGSHPLTLTVDDGRHKHASADVVVVVQDTTAPLISGTPADIVAEAASAAGSIVSWTPPTATDVVDGVLSVNCAPASGSAFPIGTTPVVCSVVDAHGNPAVTGFTVKVQDTTPPVIAITSPTEGAMFSRYEYAEASFSCVDAVGVATCVGPAASGAPVDTSTKGPHTFTVTATDTYGNASLAEVHYTVVAPPVITVQSPVEPIYELGSIVLAQYDCGDATTCVGDVANGAALDTSSPGFKYFAINATDALGNMTSAVVSYSVSTGSALPPIAGITAWFSGDGGSTADEESANVATWTGTPVTAAGKVAGAFAVGNGNYLSYPFVQPGPFSLQAWVKTSDPMQAYPSAVLSTGGPGQESTSAQIELDGAGNFQVNAGNGDLVLFIGPAGNVFHHLAVTFDGTMLTTYLDGQAMLSDFWFGSPDLGVLGLNIGIDRSGLAPFSGVVDEVQVFNRAISADEVQQTFLAGASGFVKDQAPVAVAVAIPGTVEAVGPAGATMTLDASRSSDADGDALTFTWREGATVLGTGPELQAPLSVGSHAITLVADDGRFKTGSSVVIATVQDGLAPVISGVPASFSLEATGPGGTIATFTTPTATDIVDGIVDVTCLPASGAMFAVGTTYVNCSARDAHLNMSSETFQVTVADTTPPVLAGVPGTITTEATSADGAVVTWTSPTATDLVDTAVNVTCVPASGSTFAAGTTPVECSATDTHGNRSSASFDVVVHDTTPPVLSNVPSTLVFEAVDASGAFGTWAPPTAFDAVDGAVPATCLPASGSLFGLGDAIVNCSAVDSRGNRSEANFRVRVVDTTPPALSLPLSVAEEATGPLGATVVYAASATDTVSGAVPILCLPASGSTFGIGVTPVVCSATDATGNGSLSEFPVIVRDTTPPAAQIVTPSPDAMLSGFLVPVTVQVSDVVGTTNVLVNGVPASLTSGSPQSGTWSALVPMGIFPGAAIQLQAYVRDGVGNNSVVNRIVDNDGIPSALDRGRTTGADQSNAFSSEFNNGITAGTLTRNGWTMTLSASVAPPRPPAVPPTGFWPATGWVQVGVGGFAMPTQAIVSACIGGVKQLRLDAVGERAAFACDPSTGTIAVKALSASPTIEVWKQISPSAWLAIPLMTGSGVSTGSPTTALPDNPAPIDVRVVRYDDAGVAHVVGTLRLAPGASADVSITADQAGQDDRVVFRALHGRVPMAMSGRSHVLTEGDEPVSLPIDRTPPAIDIRSPRPATEYTLGQSVVAAFTCADRDSGVATCEGTAQAGQPIRTASVGASTFTVQATDQAGNAETASVAYAVTYAIEAVAPLLLRLTDAHGENRSAADVPLTVQTITDDSGVAVPGETVFRFDEGAQAYRLDLPIASRGTGPYAVSFTAAGDPIAHSWKFRVR